MIMVMVLTSGVLSAATLTQSLHFDRGMKSLTGKEYETAIHYFTKSLSVAPSKEAYSGLAESYLKHGQTEKSVIQDSTIILCETVFIVAQTVSHVEC